MLMTALIDGVSGAARMKDDTAIARLIEINAASA